MKGNPLRTTCQEPLKPIRAGAFVQRAVEEVEGAREAELLQFRDELPLRIAVRDVADPQLKLLSHRRDIS